MFEKMTSLYHEYPRTFWIIIVGMFIDRLGAALIFPFFGLYITSKYTVGMTEVGVLFSIIALTSVIGSLIGRALTDKFGRKVIIIVGLVISGGSSLLLAFAPNLNYIYLAGLVVGLFGNMAGPAHQAMIADLLPEHLRADGYGILRVVANLSFAIGPAIGGFLATRSYTLLFIIDVIASLITALIIFSYVPETKPKIVPHAGSERMQEETLLETLTGYFKVAKDQLFMVFLLGSLLMILAYMQMNTSLPVYLRDIHGLPDQGYGVLLSMNASMVVLFQFWITRRIKRLPPLKLLAWGMVIYVIGFSMYGYVSTFRLFSIAMVIITIAEMLVSPTSQTIVAKLSPADMRGRYMAVFVFAWTIPTAVGPLAAGLIMDNYNPNWVWYACGISMLLSASIFAGLQLKASNRFAAINGQEPSPALEIAAP